jgi:hypothetical protein
MSSLIKTTNNSGLATPGSISVGESASTEGLKFSERAEQYSDLPTEFRKGASSSNAIVLSKEAKERQGNTSVVLASSVNIQTPIYIPPTVADNAIASGVRKLSKNFKSGNRIVQRKLGWFAMPSYIYVTTVERELEWVGEKKLAPKGPWLIENRRKWVPRQGVAEKRSGVVPVDVESGDNGSSSRFVEVPEQIPDAFAQGANAMGYLPKVVRGDIASAVSHPNYFDGRLLGLVNPETDEVDQLEVSLLRMDDTTALVVRGVRSVDGNSWEITQARYSLSTPEVESA